MFTILVLLYTIRMRSRRDMIVGADSILVCVFYCCDRLRCTNKQHKKKRAAWPAFEPPGQNIITGYARASCAPASAQTFAPVPFTDHNRSCSAHFEFAFFFSLSLNFKTRNDMFWILPVFGLRARARAINPKR